MRAVPVITDLLTTAQAAALLTERGCTDRSGGPVKPDTVIRWCQRGALPAQRIGGPHRGSWLIDPADLDDWQPPAMGRPRKD